MVAILAFAGKGNLEGLLLNLLLIGVFLIVEIIAALFMLSNANTKIYGQAMLLSIGIIFLVGFSWCGLNALNH